MTSLEPAPGPDQQSQRLEALPKPEQTLAHKVLETRYTDIWMGPPEVNLVLRYIHDKKNYLESGSGSSTLNFPRWCRNAVSIEHDSSWCSKMEAKIAEDAALQHIDYHCIPVQRGTGGWGKTSPFEESNYTVFNKYVDEIENASVDIFDFILIDGRARVDCAIKVLSYINSDSIVALHDAVRIWNSGIYREVETYYTLVYFVGGFEKLGIAILRRKKEFAKLQGDRQAVQQILNERYQDFVRNTTDKKTGLGEAIR